MATASTHDGRLAEMLKRAVKAELDQAADAVIAAAMAEYEKKLRRIMSVAVVAQLEKSFSAERFGDDLHVTVRYAYEQLKEN